MRFQTQAILLVTVHLPYPAVNEYGIEHEFDRNSPVGALNLWLGYPRSWKFVFKVRPFFSILALMAKTGSEAAAAIRPIVAVKAVLTFHTS
jgi:hypothetical protein